MSSHRNGEDQAVSLTSEEVAEIFLETQCRVCGDKASGVHYGVESCEGCKGFYRRTSSRGLLYSPCSYHGNCEINRSTRNRCQSCRYEKCLRVGMSINAVKFGRIPHMQKQIKFAERYAEWRKKTQDNSTLKRPRLKPELTNVEENGCSAKTKKAKLHSLAQQAFAKSPKSDTVRKIPPNKDLSNHKQRETLTNGIYTNGQYMRNLNTSTLAATASSNIFNRYPFFPTYLSLPTVETPLSYLDDSQRISFSSYLRCKKESNSIGGGDRSGGDKIFQENIAQSNNVISYVDLTAEELNEAVHRAYERTILELTLQNGCESSSGTSSGSGDPTVKAIVNFAKEIPGFSTLSSSDKVVLLKWSVSEVCYILRALDCGSAGKIESIEDMAGHIEASKKGTWISTFSHFTETFLSMELKPQAVGLFIAIVITSSGRAGVTNQKSVQNIHDRLLISLSTQLEVSKGQDELLTYSNLLLMIPKLRSLTYLSL